MSEPVFFENEELKILRSLEYNYFFNKRNGLFLRTGKDEKDDPQYAESPEILDLEISTGKCLGRCKFCYKANGEDIDSKQMSLEIFKKIIDRFVFQVEFADENGKSHVLKANQKVKLKSGEIMLASQLEEGMDVLDFLI